MPLRIEFHPRVGTVHIIIQDRNLTPVACALVNKETLMSYLKESDGVYVAMMQEGRCNH